MEVSQATLAQWNATQVNLERPRGSRDEQLKAVATEFEALFVKQMLDTMRATLNKQDDLLGGGFAEEVFEDMLYDEYSRMIAATGSLGVAELITESYSSHTQL
ncbi:MAG: rod-binding protein [Spirochaetales bacterium]